MSKSKKLTPEQLLAIDRMLALQAVAVSLSPLGLNQTVTVLITHPHPDSDDKRVTEVYHFGDKEQADDIEFQYDAFVQMADKLIQNSNTSEYTSIINDFSGKAGEA